MQNITTIQLIGDGVNTQNGYLDLTEETIIPITYSIGDVRDITKKNGTFSKSIKIKGTKNNNILLNHYFDVNESAGTFNIDVIQPCIVLQNGVPIFPNAVIQLISVEKVQTTNQYDEQTEYTLLIKDTAGDFFTQINNGYLEDLNLGLTNHTFNATAITSTFNYDFTRGYKYINSFNPSRSTQGNTYDDNQYNIEEFKPAIFARTYWDSIFYNAGYNYNWSTMNDQTIQFNRLLIPFSNDEFKDDNLISFYNVQAQSTGTTFATGIFQKKAQIFYTTQNYYESGSAILVKANNELVDTGNNYNPITSSYTNPDLPSNKNNITYTVTFTYNISFINNESSQTLFYAPFDWNNSHNFSVNGDLVIRPNVFLKDNNNVQYDKQQIISDIVIPKNTSFPLGTTTISPSKTVTLKFVAPNISIPKTFTLNSKLDLGMTNATYGDSIITWRTAGLVTSDQYSLRFNITNAVVRIDANVMGDFGFNTTINFFDPIKQINPFAPKKIKQSDFVKSILTMFNLYTEIDINNPKVINIYRRDDYYDTGALKDWTEKICKEIPQEVKFLPELSSKKLLLTYKQDSDYANKTYFDATGEVYGQQEFTFDNQYVKGIDKKEILFSPTPMYNSKFGAILPMMIGSAPATNIKILYDGGEKPCSGYTIINYVSPQNSAITNSISATTYSYANHWDTPVDPTYDLNFGICDYYYRTDAYGSPTNNTLFNSHWRRTINLINNGKMLTAMFTLTEDDITKLRLNDKIFINNSWWNINRIIDYNANSNVPTKCELISIDDFLILPFTERQTKFLTKTSPPYVNAIDWLGELRNPFINWNGGTQFNVIGMNNYVSPAVNGGTLIGSNNGLGGGTQFVIGDYNAMADDAFVFGDNNTFSSKAFVVGNSNSADTGTNIVMGNGNVITSGVTDAIILGNSITATTGNTVFANNITLPADGFFIIGDTIYDEHTFTLNSASLSTGLYEFGEGGIVVTSPTTFSVGHVKGWIVDSHDVLNANPFFVDFSGTTGMTTPFLNVAPATYVLINSASTVTLTATYPTTTDRRNNIYLGVIGHPTSGLTGVGNAPEIIMNEMSQVRAMFEPMKFINNGVTVYNFNTTLQLANTSGLLHGLGIGFIPNGNDSPTILNISAGTPTTFQYRTQSGGTFANTILIDPTNYDVGGTVTPVPNPVATATNQRFYLLQNGVIRAQFGQTTYANLASAVAGAQTETFAPFSNNTNLGILIGILSIQKNCTNLSDTSTARFLSVSKFGESVGSAGGISTASLQSAYNNSINPEIVTNSTLGAFTLIRGSASDANNVFEVGNGLAVIKASITGNGAISATSFTSTITGGTPAILLNNSGVGSAMQINDTGANAGALFVAHTSTGTTPALEVNFGNNAVAPALRIAGSGVENKGILVEMGNLVNGNSFDFIRGGIQRAHIDRDGNVHGNKIIRNGGAFNQYLMGDGDVIIRPLVYVALMTQVGTGNPTTVIAENTFHDPIVWTRNSAGVYTGTLVNAFTADKTICFTQGGVPFSANANQTIRLYRNDINTLTLVTIENGVLIDSSLSLASIEVRVYP